MNIQILYIILASMFGIIGYLHYIIDKQAKELTLVWAQIAILAAATAKKLTELENKSIKEDEKQ